MTQVKVALRSLSREPRFSLSVIVVLALSTGVSTGLFGVISTLLLKPIPGVAGEGLVTLHVDREGEDDPFAGFSHPTFLDFQERSRSLQSIAAFNGRSFALEVATHGSENAATDGARSNQSTSADALVGGMLVSGGYFELMGTKPLVGRLLNAGDDTPGAASVAVITQALWRQRFDSKPEAMGQTLRVNGQPFTLVGVTETGFRGQFVGFPLDIYVPLTSAHTIARDVDLLGRGDQNLEIAARLKDGVAIGAAQAELKTIAADLARTYPEALRGQSVELHAYSGLDADLRGPVIGFMGVLALVGALVLLVAAANISSLVMARNLARSREMAVRTALGASGRDLLRPIVAETLILFSLGGLLGATLIQPAASALHAFLPPSAVPLQFDLVPDLRVGLFALLVTFAAGLIVGLGPAARSVHFDLILALRSGGRGMAGGPGGARGRFVTAQVALCMILLFGAGLFLRELQRARVFEPGFRTDGVSLISVDVSLLGLANVSPQSFFEAWLERVRTDPGVEAAALTARAPLGLGGATTRVLVNGIEPPTPDGFSVGWSAIGPGYFNALQISLVAGRDFAPADAASGEGVAIVSRATAERFFPQGNAVGSALRREGRVLRIVGIAENVATDRTGARNQLFVYEPFSGSARGTMLIRAAKGTPLVGARRAARELLPGLPILSASTLEARASAALFPQRLAAAVTAACGAFGLLLASVGLYALVSWFVEEKRRELAVRAALGATRRRLHLLALRQGLTPVARGLLIGGGLALLLGRLFESFVPTVGAADPLALVGSGALLFLVALMAAAPPARRAGRTSPAEVLRGE